MAVAQASLPLSYFYPQIEGSEHLSQNLSSNELFTPLQPNRITISQANFEKHRDSTEKQPRLPWGRVRDYGGLQRVQLPNEFIKPKTFPPEVVQKGHRHYGTGASDQRDYNEQQFYDITNLKRSDVRSNDQLLPNAASQEMNEKQIDLPFPAEHPYYSHTSRLAVIPKFNTPADPVTGDPSRSDSPIHPNAAANPYRVMIVSKTKGAPYRKEIQEYPFESGKYALTWNGENDFYQLMKTPTSGQQPYYPSPPKIVHPNLRLRDESQRLELRSVNCLRNVEREQWKTIYQYNYTGYGESNAMHLDDYHTKAINELTEGRDSRNDALMPKSVPILTSPRPMEGRYSRLYQGRKPILAQIRYPDEEPNPDRPDVMDFKLYSSLPSTVPKSRIKDEWYKTAEKNAANQDDDLLDIEDKSPRYSRGDGEHFDWKKYQLLQHPDHGLDIVLKTKMSKPDPESIGAYACLPKGVDEQDNKAEARQTYLKDSGKERSEKFEMIDRHHELQNLEMQYLADHDIHALRNKTDQMGNRVEPKALDQHAIQATTDDARMQVLLSRAVTKERFDTGLKFSTEKISEKGLLSDLHDRQLSGYKRFQKHWLEDIPTVESPRQNHSGVLSSYINRTNPFSLSLDCTKEPQIAREGKGADLRNSSTGSILKTPGSPPRTGASRSITFNEVVRVVTSEYGDQFRVTTSPLSKSDTDVTRKGSLNLSKRSPTPLPPPIRQRREPSVHQDISPRGPVLRSSRAYPHRDSTPQPQPTWKWNYDSRLQAEFDPLAWSPRPHSAMPQTSLLDVQDNWTKSDAHKRLHENFPENAPDFRDNTRNYELADNSADLRFTRSAVHREKRHQFYGYNGYHFHNANPIV